MGSYGESTEERYRQPYGDEKNSFYSNDIGENHIGYYGEVLEEKYGHPYGDERLFQYSNGEGELRKVEIVVDKVNELEEKQDVDRKRTFNLVNVIRKKFENIDRYGIIGEKGPTGNPGAQGQKGIMGDKGITGHKGIKGDKGKV